MAGGAVITTGAVAGITRFRLPWWWDGSPTVLKSRATDDTGAVQPTRDKLIQAWSVQANGEFKNVYA